MNYRFQYMKYMYNKNEYWFRLEYELDIITRMGFSNYFLVVQDFVNWAKNNYIRVGPGRGSVAGSLASYALKITDTNPLIYELLFERFLNPERISMPDIDIDFMKEKRIDIIQYVTNIYGKKKVAQIITYSELTPKSVIKNIAKILNLSFSNINKLTQSIPNNPNGLILNIEHLLLFSEKLKASIDFNKVYQIIINISKMIEGLYKQAGIHAGGIVIGNQNLIEYTPLFIGSNQEKIIQFDKDRIDELGLIKFDFLGLNTLDIIDFTVYLVNKRIYLENSFAYKKRIQYSIYHKHYNKIERPSFLIPKLFIEELLPNNLDIYKYITNGNTQGIFQMESFGFSYLCKELKPDCFNDIVALLALYRPGPLKSGMVKDFIYKKHNPNSINYLHKKLNNILKTTYGSFIYQEQIMNATRNIAGYTLGESDILRKAMGKKDIKEMKKQKNNFIKGAKNQNIKENDSSYIFDNIYQFSSYCFNRSHSTSYALLSYQTAYLKFCYPLEFIASMLTIAIVGKKTISWYLYNIQKKGFTILKPDIGFSERYFSIEYRNNYFKNNEYRSQYGCLRYALNAVKWLNGNTIDLLLNYRNKGFIHNMNQNFKKFVNYISNRNIKILLASNILNWYYFFKLKKYTKTNILILSTKIFHYEIWLNWNIHKKLILERKILDIYLSYHPLNKYHNIINCFINYNVKFYTPKYFNRFIYGGIYSIARDFKTNIILIGIIINITSIERKNSELFYLIFDYGWGQFQIICSFHNYNKLNKLIIKDIPIIIEVDIILKSFISINKYQDKEINYYIHIELINIESLQDICSQHYKQIQCVIDIKQYQYNIYILLLKFLSICFKNRGSCKFFIGIDFQISPIIFMTSLSNSLKKNNIFWFTCKTIYIYIP